MAATAPQWELALDQSGSADARTVRCSLGLAAAIVLLGGAVVAFAGIRLPVFPQFAIFHAGLVCFADAVTAWLLLGQFGYRRRPIYPFLAAAYLFNSLAMVPFLLSFPGALKAAGGVIGDAQSAIWVWHSWHIFFPALVLLGLAFESRRPDGPVAAERTAPVLAAAVLVPLALVLAVTAGVTIFHDFLPVLIDGDRRPLTWSFYGAGSTAAAVTLAAVAATWRRGWQRRSILHLWLAVALTAFLADDVASLSAPGRYSVAWYFGRIESMIAGSVLLLVFLGEINRLYARLGAVMVELSNANARLVTLVDEKDALVEDLQRSERQVRQLAYYDTLTNLPNRRLLMDRLEHAVAQARRHQCSMAVMFMDLDRFKQINDTLGHEAGDELLRQVAARLAGCVRAGDTVARSGGDEFIIVLAEIAHVRDAGQVAQKLIEAVGEPVVVGEHRLMVTASVGIAIYPVDGGDDMHALMQKADLAMYAAKDAGRNAYRFYGDLAALEK